MAQRIPRDESLSRVHGVGALFSAAYGNVGSSIYYALGVTAAFALGLTPVAFVVSGLIFAATAATYAEATVMFPEAGDQDGAADDVAGAVAEPGPEDGQVVGHEEGRDRDRDRVVEHLPPG
ncbi:MAG TPA: hypothetical protein VK480_08850, partial [Solirubrobacterales bacterium]|nr:hypothetical protein [Solirubrobacterales bacterium]